MARTVLPADPPWLKAAFSKLGLSEIPGSKHEAEIIAMYAACGHKITNDETAWCAAFVGWCLWFSGLPNTRSLMARSYVKYGRALDRTKPIPRGAIAVWPRGAPPSGHVNFVLEDDGTYLTCIGGNQSNGRGGGVTISRERKSNLVAVVLPISKVVPLPKPKPQPDEESDQPEFYNQGAGRQSDDAGVEQEEVAAQEKPPWYKRAGTYVTGTLAGGMGLGGFSLDGDVLKYASVFVVVAFIVFLGYVYLVPPRGAIQKGWK